MVTDNWASEEGYIVEGLAVGFCECGDTITLMSPVKFGTSAANKIVVANNAAVGDSVGVALKYGVAGDAIPVAFSGIVKMVTGCTITVGDFLINLATDYLVSSQATANSTNLKIFGGATYVLGMALQANVTSGDEILVLLGKCL